MYYVLHEYICSMCCMKGSVQIHFRNSEMDEGYFVDFLFLFCPVCDKTIGGGYILKPFLSTSPCLHHFFGLRKNFCSFRYLGNIYGKKWLGFETWIRHIPFLLVFVFPLGYEVYNLHECFQKKKKKKTMYLIP